MFKSYRRPTKHQVGFEITTKDLTDLINNHEYDTFTALQRSRSFPAGLQFTVKMANLLSRIAEEGSIQWDVNDKVLRECYMNGWVHRMHVPLRRQNGKGEEVAILPSRLHEK